MEFGVGLWENSFLVHDLLKTAEYLFLIHIAQANKENKKQYLNSVNGKRVKFSNTIVAL